MKRHFPRMILLAAMAAFGAFAQGQAGRNPAGAQIPWRLPTYTLVARDMDLRTAIDTFAVAEGVPAVMSDSVRGVFSGDFRDVHPQEFLDKISTTHNLIWYYDGAALYLYGAGEVSTMLVDLRYMKAGEVREMLAELGIEDARYPIKPALGDELIMVSGPPRYVGLVAEMVMKADALKERRNLGEVEARIFPLTYTWADDVSFSVSSPESQLQIKGVASLLEDIMSSVDANGDGYRDVMITNELTRLEAARMMGFRPMIKAENRLNAVIVRDVISRMPMYERLIKQLDVPQKLVEIEVTVVELSRKDALDWQLSLSATGTKGDRTKYGAGQNAANLFGIDDVEGKGLAGAVTHVRSHMGLSASITALREKGKARSISRTMLLTVNNLAAAMTDTQSYHAKVVGSEVATLQEVSAGTTLQVKPRILPALSTNIPNQVWLSLKLDDGGFEAITVESMPMSRSSTLQTQTAIFEDESIILAGYLRDISEDAGWGIPFLRDIPLIGWLFGGKSTRTETVQRMFVLTPHIVDLDQEMLARIQATRLRDISIGEEVQRDYREEDEEEETWAQWEPPEEFAEEEGDFEEPEAPAPEAEEAPEPEAEDAPAPKAEGKGGQPMTFEAHQPKAPTPAALPVAPEPDLEGITAK